MLFAMLMISFKRGTPRVTFLADTPAKWNVFNVICVAGSPIDCAATVPIPSPGGASAILKRDSISPMTQSKPARVSLCSFSTRLAAKLARTCAKNSIVPFRCASMDKGSVPGTTMSFGKSSATLSMMCVTLTSSSPESGRYRPYCFCAFHKIRFMFTGKCT